MKSILKPLMKHIFPPAGDDMCWAQSAAADLSIEATQRELAVLAAEMMGVQSYLGQFGAIRADRAQRRRLREMIDETATAYMVIDPRPGLHIIDVTESYAASTLTRRHDIGGDRLFDTFPDNPGDPGADGVSNLYGSIQKAAQTGQPHAMAVQRYDVRDAAGHFVERYWRPINIPVFDDNERLLYILHDAGELSPEDLHPAALRTLRQRTGEA